MPWWARNSTRPYLTPRQVRRRSLRGTLTGLTFLVALLLGITWVLTATGVKEVSKTRIGALAHKQTTDALIAGCGPIYTFPDATVRAESGTVPPADTMGIPNRQKYRTVVPMFGPFWNKPAPAEQRLWRRTEPAIPVAENLLANLWTGSMVVYYTHKVPASEVAALERLVEHRPDLDLIAVPWEHDVRGPMPQRRNIAFVAWNASQTCHQFLTTAVYDFRKAHPPGTAPGATGRKPPVLDDKPPLNVQSR